MLNYITIELLTHTFTMPSTDSFRQAICCLLLSIQAGRDNTAINSLPILYLKVVLFLIFNDGSFKGERDAVIHSATVYEVVSFNTMIVL